MIINDPTLKFPIKIKNAEHYVYVCTRLHKMGYTWYSGASLIDWNLINIHPWSKCGIFVNIKNRFVIYNM